VSGTGLITPEATGPKASVETPIPGLISGGSDICCWDVVASGPVILPPLSQGIFVGKIRGKNNLDVPREVLVEPVGMGTPGAYVARVASGVYTRKELDALGDLEGRLERNSGSSRDNDDVEAYANDIRGYGKELSLQASASNAVMFCVLKILNTSRQHVEIGKNVKLKTAEALLQRAPKVTGFDSRNLETGETSACRVNCIRGNNQILMPVMDEYLDLFCNKEGVLPCTTKRYHEIRTGDVLPVKKCPYRVPYALREEMKPQLDEMNRKKVITPCASPWAAPVILVPKKSVGGTQSTGFAQTLGA